MGETRMTRATLHETGVKALRTLVDETEALCDAYLGAATFTGAKGDLARRLAHMDKLVKTIRKAESARK